MVPLLGAFLASVLGWYRAKLAYTVTLASVGFSLAASVTVLVDVLRNGDVQYRLGGWAPPIGIEVAIDPLSAFVAVVVTAVALIVLVPSRQLMANELPAGGGGPYASVVLLLMAGLTGIIITGDLFNLFVFLEIASLAAYALVAVGGGKATVSGFRYLILGTIGGSFYLLGVGLIYFMTGTLNMADAARLLPEVQNTTTIVAAVVLITTGLGLKMALFPLHQWLPDAYAYAPSAVSALIAPIVTKVYAYALIRMYLSVFPPSYITDVLPISTVLVILGMTGIVFGSVMAFAQQDIRRMLAYSSISQLAFIALGIGLANSLALIGAVLHIMNHAVMKACLFLAVGSIRRQAGTASIPQLAGLGRRMPLTMGAFTVGALSMIGVPPSSGFFSKWYLIQGGIDASNWAAVAVILISSLLTAVYFFKVLEKIYFGIPEHSQNEAVNEAPAILVIPTWVFAIAMVALGVVNAFVVSGILDKAIGPNWGI
ncbi:MAG: multicomponent Na+:H+ antiporter subunit D [Chloroflexi bacterium]|jgi:multicomponent Na+:H+ antiporter subunit D|nr:MAG: multicomponent Na+:H+ antiporter subunit D [Chloroflexota bacterium]